MHSRQPVKVIRRWVAKGKLCRSKGGPVNATRVIYWYIYEFAFNRFQMGYATAAAVVLVIIRFGTAIPSSPGNAGVQQYLCVVGLKLFYVPDATAFQVANVMFGILTLPLLIAGLVALALAGLKLGDIRSRAHSSLRPTAEATSD